jgi:hypothetical protein
MHPCTTTRGSWTSMNPTLRTASSYTWPIAILTWIPGRNTVATINKFTVIKTYPSDFGFQPNDNIILSHISEFIQSYRQPREGDQSTGKTQNQKLCSMRTPPPPWVSPNSPLTSTNIPADIDSNDLEDASPAVAPTNSNNNTLDYWQQPIDDELLTISDEVPYLRQSIRNLRFHYPVDAVILKATSCITVKNPFKSTSARLSQQSWMKLKIC